MHISKKYLLFVGLVLLIIVAGFFWHRKFPVQTLNGNEIKTLTIGHEKFQAEVVSSQDKLELGLGGRDNLCSTCAMLFMFPKTGIYSFWMKGMQFPLDILWVSSGTIVHIEKNVQPDFTGIFTPPENADSVLELNAGTIDKLGLKVGDKLQ